MPIVSAPRELTAEEKLASAFATLTSIPDNLWEMIFVAWKAGIDKLWTDEGPGATPADKMAVLGTAARRICEGSGRLAGFLINEAQISGDDERVQRVMAALAPVPELQYNEDGTVTIPAE